jgi:hypothetical protein
VRLLDRQVVREAGDGRYWVDQDALKHGFGGRTGLLLGAVLLLAAVLILAGVMLLPQEAAERRQEADRGWTADPLSPSGVALIHTGRKGVEWEIRCRATPADLMVVTTDRPRGEVELRVDGQSFPLEVPARDGGAGVFAFGAVTPAFLEALQDGAEIEVRHGPRQRGLGALSAAQAAPFVEGCRDLQQPAARPSPAAP